MKNLTYIFVFLTLSQFVVAQNNALGINKKDNLRSAVDVNGNVSIENVETTDDPSTQTLLISKDESSRKLLVYPKGSKPFTILNLKLQTEKDSDWLDDIDLRIPTDKYYIVPSNAYLGNELWDKNISEFPPRVVYGLSHTFKNGSPDGDVYNAQQKIVVSEHPINSSLPDNNTWHLSTDYFGASPTCKNDIYRNNETCDDYYWFVTLFVFDRGFVDKLNTYRADSESGSNENIIDILQKKKP